MVNNGLTKTITDKNCLDVKSIKIGLDSFNLLAK